MLLSTLLEQNATNYYKMLVIVDNSHQEDKIISALTGQGWTAIDVEAEVLKLISDMPPEKIKLRIGDAIKQWFNGLPDKIILYNTSILYSPDLGRLNPVGAFKYKARERELIVLLEGQEHSERIVYSQYGRPDHCEMDVSELIHTRMEAIEL
jgi:hypothetical protein